MLKRAQKPSTRKVYEGLQKKNGRNSSLFSRIISARALNSFGVLVALVCVLALLTLALVTGPTVEASNPTNGTLTTTSAPVSWQGTAVGGGATGDPAGGSITSEEMCVEGVSCDTFTLTIAGAPADWVNAKKLVHVHLGWTITGQDFDFYIHKGDLNGPVVASSGNGVTNGILLSEDADLDPAKSSVGTGVFAVHVVYWTATAAEQYQATASVENVPAPPSPTPTPTPTNEPAGTPRFYNYQAPPGVADDAGEPSIGVNWKSEKTYNGIPNGGTVNYFGGFLPYMLRATFNDSFFPAKVTWEKASITLAATPRYYGDPILFTDSRTGRTFVSQEEGSTPFGSTSEWTDDDGGTFFPSEGSGAPSGIDHQTIGGGPYHAPVPNGVNPVYPNGVWYCSQSVVDAVCSLSLDGGMTFGPAVPMYSLADCGGLHGHIKIGPDGTAYVPNRACHGDPSTLIHEGGKPGLIVSEDNGITWQIRMLEHATTIPARDPSVAIGSDGTVYFAYQAGDGHSRVAVSRDKGVSWTDDTDIGAQLGIKNSLFHAAVSGDGDRAAVAFFGTTTGGADYDQPAFEGVWYLYIATTYDRGKHWWTQNATPGDPIQRGGICDDGGCRNLLDFFGADVDKEGRVLVGYDDGCISRACITGQRSYGMPGGNDFTAKAVIARQTGGKTMFSQYDPPAGPVAEPPTRPLPPAAGTSCDGVVAVDSTGDAGNPVQSMTGSADQFDITKLTFGLTDDKQSLVTTVTLKNFSIVPPPGTVGGVYRTVWTSAKTNADGSLTSKIYATEVSVDPSGASYTFGQYDPAEESFVSGTTSTPAGTYTEGENGTLKVTVPLSALGNPVIPVTDPNALPAVIEPYAVVFGSLGAVYFASPIERAPDYGFAGANWAVCVPPTVVCLEDDDKSISYTDGWHTVNATGASGGHFRFHSGKSPDHSATLSVTVDSGRTGKLTYYYGTSTKGGSAEVFIDGISKGTINYAGSSGGLKDPVFGPKVEFANLAAGQHKVEIKNMSDGVYVDRFCLESSASSGQPTSGPGQTTTNTSNLSAGQELLKSLSVGSGSTAISVVAASSNNLPIKLALISPTGAILQVVNSSNGVAVINAPVSQSGNYVVKTVNLSLGPVQVWTVATPTVRR
ncbi:MAG TPA: sialidase family protein [Pyrinomonadaceae bacterium]|nr:sialidase family protein [Pyrinomonadaceae bacterium]